MFEEKKKKQIVRELSYAQASKTVDFATRTSRSSKLLPTAAESDGVNTILILSLSPPSFSLCYGVFETENKLNRG